MFKPLMLLITAICSFGILAAATPPAFAASDQIYTSSRNNLSAGGYDVVSYHTGNPIKGSESYSTNWNGADWRFSSQENLDIFLADKEKYAPAYGGYCAWALAKNKLAKGNPKHWAINDGVLYLNYNKKIRKKWLADQDNFIVDADSNWPKILE